MMYLPPTPTPLKKRGVGGTGDWQEKGKGGGGRVSLKMHHSERLCPTSKLVLILFIPVTQKNTSSLPFLPTIT